MEINLNKIYKPLISENVRYYLLMGGRASGRSYSASQFILVKLLSSGYFRCAIMRFVLSDIRNSIYQEIQDRIEENDLDSVITTKENTLEFKYKDNKVNGIGFRKSSSEQKSKLKSLASYNCVVIEEADEVTEEDFQQLDDSLRTIKSDIMVVLLLNPPHKNHWIIRKWFNLVDSGIDGFYKAKLRSDRDDSVYIHGTYLENIVNLNHKSIVNFERYKKTNPDHYYNMIRGLVSEGSRGRVYKDWTPINVKEFDALPFDSIYGLDFGYSNDPTALIEIKMHNDNVWLRELIYQTGLTNQLISKRMEELGVGKNAQIYADSAEPKSIEELRQEDWNAIASQKGPDSIRAGIKMLMSKKICYTEDSLNVAREIQEYKWALDKQKEPTNKPIDDYNHALDAIRYGVMTNLNQPFIGVI
jgi:phage terminase large subunit